MRAQGNKYQYGITITPLPVATILMKFMKIYNLLRVRINKGSDTHRGSDNRGCTVFGVGPSWPWAPGRTRTRNYVPLKGGASLRRYAKP